MEMDFKFLPHGDSALLVEFSTEVSEIAWEKAHYVAVQLNHLKKKIGVLGTIPTYASVFISFDPLVTDHQQIKEEVQNILTSFSMTKEDRHEQRCFRIPVLYGGRWGADLKQVANQLDISEEQVIALHCSKVYKIRCLGARIGQPMMDGVPFPRPVSRLEVPRTRVPKGSIALAGLQTLIYTSEIPGGWQLIGQTPLRLVDISVYPPIPYKPGDYFEFFPISEEEANCYIGKSVEDMLVVMSDG